MDGCYELREKGEPVDFWEAKVPKAQEIEEVLAKIIFSGVISSGHAHC